MCISMNKIKNKESERINEQVERFLANGNVVSKESIRPFVNEPRRVHISGIKRTWKETISD